MRSLWSRLILASVLWTAGLLALMHMLSLMLMHITPSPHRIGIHLPVFLGIVLMIAGLAGLWSGLKPFRSLRGRLAAVRKGDDRRVSGSYPTEVQPLIDDLNALLDEREQAVKRAMAAAGDLAHGLKTPLAILVQEAEMLRAAGDRERADAIAQQIERMRKQVEYQLARARAAASGASPSARTDVAECGQGLSRTLAKLYVARDLNVRIEIAPGLVARVEREDLEEMLGNLMDNACKWAKSAVVVGAARHDAKIVITVEDDGPGIAPALRSVVLRRGMRADEAAPGSGLGLAIVRDLAELYGGNIVLGSSKRGGLLAELMLPC